MSRVEIVVGLIVSLAAGATSPDASPQGKDEAAIHHVQERQADAWNRHDATGYAKLFTMDGDVVNVLGWWWRGRSEIDSRLTTAFAFVFRDSKLTITDVQVRFLSSVVAIAHVRWTMVGAKTPPGMPEPREGIQLQILTKQEGEWLIASFQNTNSIPEVPFPTGPLPPPKSNR
jgi:uncharacterized protein (TIGR02246 family)